MHKGLVWAACVRYLISPMIAQRFSSGDSQFLLVKFPKAQFAEVSIRPGAHWEALEFSSLVTSSARDLTLEFLHSAPVPLHELETAQFPDFSESSSNSTLDINFISEDEKSQSQGKKSGLASLEVSPIPRGKGQMLTRTSRIATAASSQEGRQYEIYDSSLDSSG